MFFLKIFFPLGLMLNLSLWPFWIFGSHKGPSNDYTCSVWVQSNIQFRQNWVIYGTFLPNDIFIPHVASEKILKFQHQKELVGTAMLNCESSEKQVQMLRITQATFLPSLGLWFVRTSLKCKSLWKKMEDN